MKALLIDDERLARNELRRLLAAHPDIEIVGEAVDVRGRARRKSRRSSPTCSSSTSRCPGATASVCWSSSSRRCPR